MAASSMNDSRRYLIELAGRVAECDINDLSPVAVTVERGEQAATVLAACCDQSGLIGLLRHLHGLGFELLSVQLRVYPNPEAGGGRNEGQLILTGRCHP
jgi:hypothetical protein